MRTTWVLALLLVGSVWTATDAAEDLTPAQRQELEKKATELNEEGLRQYEAVNYIKAIESFRETLEIRRALYSVEQYPNGHPLLARSIYNLARLHQAAGEYGKAEPLYREALQMMRALYPKEWYPNGHPLLATSINNLAMLHQDAGEYGKAEPLSCEALQMRRALFPQEQFPNGHPHLAQSINNLAFLYHSAGEYGKAEPLYREALQMSRALYPKEQYPNGHTDLATSIHNLASLHQEAGEYGKAEPLLREALQMNRALYPKEQFPNGHPNLARSVTNLAHLHLYAGEYGKAEPQYQEALQMMRALYSKEQFPNGHSDLAATINNLASLHQEAGEYGKAEPLLREALQMNRALYPKEQYPNGHTDLALSINNLALQHQAAGEYGKAETLLQEALQMCRALFPKKQYPNGHPHLAQTIISLASLHTKAGEYGKAEPLCHEALQMYRTLLLRHADLAAEAAALNYLATQPPSRDLLLSVSHDSTATSIYAAVCDDRAPLSRLQEQRHRELTARRDPATHDLAEQLHHARLTLSQRLLRPLPNADANHAEVQRLTEAKEDLEKRIAATLNLMPLPPLTTLSPQQLAKRLPAGTCFIDLYRYTRFEQDPDVKGKKGAKRTARYLAFVVSPGREVARVELADAETIEDTWSAWHHALTTAAPDDDKERAAAAKLARLLWEPLRKALPEGLKTVYLTPDGALHQVPWAALPGDKPGTVLLEEHALCLVPHAAFLLHRLEEKPAPAAAAGAFLAVGGIDYAAAAKAPAAAPEFALRDAALSPKGLRWAALPGTEQERKQVAELARQAGRLQVLERSGTQANTEQLEHDLSGVRYAHLATHGFFADPTFRSALQIDPKEFDFQGVRDRRGGARSLLTMSGLVFAGANRTGADMAEDRGILTAEGLIGLRLEGMELAVLSACETGLGAWGGGEGVYGLQRAFHVAGCKDVVASLWKVDDDATVALMTLFYCNLWEKRLDPAEALRQAQLTLYRNPQAVPVAKKRGFDFTERDLPKDAVEPARPTKHAPTAEWAAFTFSGVRPVPKPRE